MRYTHQQWFTPAEIAVHNKVTDCWVSLNGKVLDLTDWLQHQLKVCKCKKVCSCTNKNWYCDYNCTEYCCCLKRGYPYCDARRLARTIAAYAGKDISHWFKGDEWLTYNHPITGLRTTFKQHGHGPREPVVPSTRWRPVEDPWWLDQRYVVGKATAKTRPIRITNTLTGHTVTLEVCSEESIHEIMMRYRPYNSHLMSYSWRYQDKPLILKSTLAGNGIPDERGRFSEVALPENLYIPNIMLYYNDDLTEDYPGDDCTCIDAGCLADRTACGKSE